MIGFGGNRNSARWNHDVSLVLFAIAGLVGLISRPSVLPFGPGYEMVALATNLDHYGSFANPLMSLQSGPSALAPPLYPLFLAGLMKACSTPTFLLWAVSLGDILANALAAALLPRVSQLLFNDIWPGTVAGVFWLLSAQLFPSWDANYTLPLLLLFCLFSASAITSRKILGFGVVTGLLAGFLFLLNPMTLLIFAPWLVHLLVFRGVPFRRAATYCCIVLGIVPLIATPWIARNYRVFGSVLVRTGLGLNIYFSNNDCSNTNLFDDLHSGCATVYQPNYNSAEARAFRDLGELNYDRTRLEMAKTWMRSHPDRFVHLTFSRFVAFWFPNTFEYPFKAIVIWIFTLLSIPGLVLMAYSRIPVTAFAVMVLLGYPLVYYVIVSDVRYRYPILWLSLLPAGYLFVWLVRLARERWQSIPT